MRLWTSDPDAKQKSRWLAAECRRPVFRAGWRVRSLLLGGACLEIRRILPRSSLLLARRPRFGSPRPRGSVLVEAMSATQSKSPTVAEVLRFSVRSEVGEDCGVVCCQTLTRGSDSRQTLWTSVVAWHGFGVRVGDCSARTRASATRHFARCTRRRKGARTVWLPVTCQLTSCGRFWLRSGSVWGLGAESAPSLRSRSLCRFYR